eukprot:CAMPEP_0114337316 /NCGR_PEP_ID=MMETSP0101-20121206/6287_1 /TAXON_ID=38822 ORGANISM="Pteridomonas danica, Strain PT" /NCGR_SAMPLE_ID=MMETSP0101 /ASSEMBLY_ACC=CAM_ASM_000211 /LENGTH=302 /DNA_ID=CAMNT_0001469521 /DNA_START=53 /DNA_END=961 /DNA_ORIENTATION=+
MADTSGRWSTEEHNRFLLGMDLYGKKWTKVAEFVRTRSTVQVRSHAQKHFQKVGKNGPENTNDDFEERPFQKRRLNIDILRRAIPVPPPMIPFQFHRDQPFPQTQNTIPTILPCHYQESPIPTSDPAPDPAPVSAPASAPDSVPAPSQMFTPMLAPPSNSMLPPPNVPSHIPSVPQVPLDNNWTQENSVPEDDFLPPPPPYHPKLEITFSSMEVDEKMFTALLNDDQFIIAAQKSRDDYLNFSQKSRDDYLNFGPHSQKSRDDYLNFGPHSQKSRDDYLRGLSRDGILDDVGPGEPIEEFEL